MQVPMMQLFDIYYKSPFDVSPTLCFDPPESLLPAFSSDFRGCPRTRPSNMPDNKSKAEKLAEGKKKVDIDLLNIHVISPNFHSHPSFQLKKFQSKHKGKPHSDNVPEAEVHAETEHTTSDNDHPSQDEAFSTTSSLFGGSSAAALPSFPANNKPTEQHQNIPFDQVHAYQAQTMDNYSQLSQKFVDLEQEIGRSLSNPNTSPAIGSGTEMLETQVHELTRKLNEERQNNQSLELRLREQYSNVDDLKMQLQHAKVGSVSKVQTELGPLKDQLDNQIRTVALLVGEKAELSAHLAGAESLAKTKGLENEELHAKLGASRHQVQKLKEEMSALKKSQERFDSSQQNLCTEVETTRDELKALRRANDDLAEEILEVRRKYEIKEIDFNSLEANHKEKLQEIDCLHLRLTQLVGGASADDDSLQRDRAMEANAQQTIALEAQIQELLLQVEKANSDRDTAATHYQNYVQQLNKERENWIAKVQEITKERDELTKRDQQLVHHIGDLEKQMQQQRSVQAKVTHSAPETVSGEGESERKAWEDQLTKQANDMEVLQDKLREERENVQKMSELLRTREEQLEVLERESERLRNSHVDPQQISATLESEKVAASRAMTQNQQLRAQLEEMQTAFVQITTDKANLMIELESERYMGREMRIKYGEWDEEVKTLRQKLHFKDEEMIRLTHEATEQTKNVLMLQQELNQMRRLEVNTRNQSHLQGEIVKQREQINKLQALIRRKEDEAKQMESDGGALENGDGEHTNPMEVSVAEEVDEGLRTEVTLSNPGQEDQQEEFLPEHVEVQELPSGEAMLKLEARFTRTMSEIAELTEEKQRLEHLVIQLQGETETIGEYIALYQNQRKLLRQREIEKDIQVQKIEADREEMKEKLLKLNSLVEQMLTQRNISVQDGAVVAVNGDDDSLAGQQHQDGVPELAPGVKAVSHNGSSASASRETAEQILDLLTEIKTQNTNFLTDPMPSTCSCCSGQLITV